MSSHNKRQQKGIKSPRLYPYAATVASSNKNVKQNKDNQNDELLENNESLSFKSHESSSEGYKAPKAVVKSRAKKSLSKSPARSRRRQGRNDSKKSEKSNKSGKSSKSSRSINKSSRRQAKAKKKGEQNPPSTLKNVVSSDVDNLQREIDQAIIQSKSKRKQTKGQEQKNQTKVPEKVADPSEASLEAEDDMSQEKKITDEEIQKQHSQKQSIKVSLEGSIFDQPSQKLKSAANKTSSQVSSFTRDVKKDTIKLKDQMLYATKLGNAHEELKDHFESSLQEELFQMTKEANQLSLLDLVEIVYNVQQKLKDNSSSKVNEIGEKQLLVQDAFLIAMNMTNPGMGEEYQTVKVIREPLMKHLDHRFTADRNSQNEECKLADKDEEMDNSIPDLNQHRFTNQIRKLAIDNDRINEFISKV